MSNEETPRSWEERIEENPRLFNDALNDLLLNKFVFADESHLPDCQDFKGLYAGDNGSSVLCKIVKIESSIIVEQERADCDDDLDDLEYLIEGTYVLTIKLLRFDGGEDVSFEFNTYDFQQLDDLTSELRIIESGDIDTTHNPIDIVPEEEVERARRFANSIQQGIASFVSDLSPETIDNNSNN